MIDALQTTCHTYWQEQSTKGKIMKNLTTKELKALAAKKTTSADTYLLAMNEIMARMSKREYSDFIATFEIED